MKKTNNATAYFSLALSMCIFGTAGIFKKLIALPSGFVSLARSIIGLAFLLVLFMFIRHRISFSDIKNNLTKLIFSGFFLGVNWILLFEAIDFTGVAVATVCYYLAPIFVIISSLFLFKEKLTVRKAVAVIIALIGIILVSGLFDTSASVNVIGIILGISAAVFYALVVILNKTVTDVDSYDRTAFQLAVAAVILLLYTLICEDVSFAEIGTKKIILLVILGIVHTGIAYSLYFSSIKSLPAQTVSLFSYIDPVVACVLSPIIFADEKMSVLQIIGAVAVIGSTLLFEIKGDI